ncbi:AAA family ATPase [Deinococcus marmoris]|uniref:AAA family ATPase n=1 Tax=Deinococcus marmoris TaxID=249408 RepID=UPI0009F98BAA|nr:AAA family ATPase [Deinococcus marmoris]
MALKTIDLTAQLRRIEFLVPGLFPLGYVSFLAAREGVGKTLLSAALAWQMTRPDGRGEFLGQPVKRGHVIYLNTDAADGEARSVRFWLEQHKAAYPDGDMDGVTVLESTGAGLTPEELEQLLTLAREKEAVCIIIDSFMATFPGLDSNKLDQAMRPMLALRAFAAQTGAVVIVIDHLPKKAANEREGDRGVMGSTGKTAQARSVHLLTRVPPKEVEGREVLRWEVRKNSFAKSGYALGIEVDRIEDEDGRVSAVHLEVCDLPAEEDTRDTRGDRAKAAVLSLLIDKPGQPLTHAELLATAIKGGNVKERSAKQAVKEALGTLGAQVEIMQLPKRGAPRVYTYRPEFALEDMPPIAQDVPAPVASRPLEEVLTW